MCSQNRQLHQTTLNGVLPKGTVKGTGEFTWEEFQKPSSRKRNYKGSEEAWFASKNCKRERGEKVPRETSPPPPMLETNTRISTPRRNHCRRQHGSSWWRKRLKEKEGKALSTRSTQGVQGWSGLPQSREVLNRREVCRFDTVLDGYSLIHPKKETIYLHLKNNEWLAFHQRTEKNECRGKFIRAVVKRKIVWLFLPKQAE